MPLPTKPRTAGVTALFLEEGTTITSPAGDVSRTLKPDAAEPLWNDLGAIETIDVESLAEEIDIFGGAPGISVLLDVLETKRQLNINLGLKELGALALQAMFRTESLTAASASFAPLTGKTLKGWLQLQFHDGNDNSELITLDIYCYAKIDGGVTMGSALMEPTLAIRTLYSSLAGGTIH